MTSTLESRSTNSRLIRVYSEFCLVLICFLLVEFVACSSTVLGQDEGQVPVEIIKQASTWKYYAATDKVLDQWNSIAFDDSKWSSGNAGFGYGDADDRTILDNMQGRFTSVFLRNTFHVVDPAKFESLYLYVNYDDGFIAYLNGKQIAAASADRVDGTARVELHEAEGFERFEIPNANKILQAGSNVLAIEGHNADVNSSDFSLDPLLRTKPTDKIAFKHAVAEYREDLDELRRRLLDQSSYLTRRGFDYETAISEFRLSIDERMTPTDFADGLTKIIAQIGDCHASVYSVDPPEIAGFLPFRFADTRDGIAALKLESDAPLNESFPYLVSLDGHPIEKWLDIAGQYVAFGSPQFRRHWSLERMVYFDPMRNELGVAQDAIVRIVLRSKDGNEQTEMRTRLTAQPKSVARIQQKPSRLLDQNIGYIRIPSMDNRLVEPTVRMIKQLRETDGLIIDVRDNSGGTYRIMRGIYPFFRPADAEPFVTNKAAYRLSENFSFDHIAYRPTYPAEWDEWSDKERKAIDTAINSFKPDWTPPHDLFSKWHFMILSRERCGRTAGLFRNKIPNDYFHYTKPVVVLSNAGSFSATDGFLNAFAELPTVTILGEPSGGGSGATRRFRLPNTNIEIALSSMASFRPNGKLFDGNGVEVDIEMKPTLEDFISDSDSLIDRATEIILKK